MERKFLNEDIKKHCIFLDKNNCLLSICQSEKKNKKFDKKLEIGAT